MGAFALALYGHPRATGGIDIWIRPDRANAERLMIALRDFGFVSLQITPDDMLSGKIIQLGHPPVRIDIITKLSDLTADEIWDSRVEGPFGDRTVHYIGRETYIKKQARRRKK